MRTGILIVNLLIYNQPIARPLHGYSITKWNQISVFWKLSQLAHAGSMSWGNAQWSAEKQLLVPQIWNHSTGEGVTKSRGNVAVETEGWWFGRGICRNPMTDWLMLPWLLVPRWCKLKRHKEDSIIIICILFPQLQLDESPGAQRGQQNPFLRITT